MTQRQHPWLTVSGLIAMGLIGLAGCGEDRPGVMGDDPRIIVHDIDGGMDALIIGTLEYDQDSRCLFIRHDNGVRTAPLWPPGTTPVLRDGRRGVDVGEYGVILEGDRIEAGGGGTSDSQVSHLNIPNPCIPDVEPGNSGLTAITDLG